MTARKSDQVVELIRARIADGSLRPGMLAPSSPELAKELGFAVLTCRKALQLLFAEGELTRMSRSGRYRVVGDAPPGNGQELAEALAARRRAAGLTQPELARAVGMSVTTVGHAETGRLWQSRRFWEKAALALDDDGALLALFDAWRTGSPPGPATGEPVMPTAAVAPDVPAAPAEPDASSGVVITLPCDPIAVTVVWADGSVTTVRPGLA